jgi:cobalt/nickel transport system permease protein
LLPAWIIVAGFAATAIVVALCLQKLKRDEDFVRKVSLLAILSALMLVAMSVPLGFIHYHVNLTVLVSLLVGPWLAFIGVFVVNFFLSFVGHGGISVMGLNTLIVGSEVFIAYYIFFGLKRFIKTIPAVLGATVLTLLLSSLLMVSVVATAGLSPALLGDDHDHHECSDDHEHDHDDHEDEHVLAHPHDDGGGFYAYLEPFLKFILPLLVVGALIEAAVTAGIVSYLRKVKPVLVKSLYEETDNLKSEG